MQTVLCGECGKRLPPGAAFCGVCGASVAGVDRDTPTRVPPRPLDPRSRLSAPPSVSNPGLSRRRLLTGGGALAGVTLAGGALAGGGMTWLALAKRAPEQNPIH